MQGSTDHKDDKCFLCERPVGYECLHNVSTCIMMLMPCTTNNVVVYSTHYRKIVFEEFENPFLAWKGQDLMLLDVMDDSVGKQLKSDWWGSKVCYLTMTREHHN